MTQCAFGLMEGGRVVDLRPMMEGGRARIWNGSGWEAYSGYTGSLMEARPISAENAARIIADTGTWRMGSETGF